MITMVKNFPVLEMSCAACAASVESVVAAQSGVRSASVNYASQTLTVDFDPKMNTPESLQQAVRSAGYDLILPAEETDERQEDRQEAAQKARYRQLQRDTLLAGVFAGPTAAIGMFLMHWPPANWMMLALTAPVVFLFGRRFFVHAWKQARHGRANMDTLVALSTGIAFAFSAFNTVYPSYFRSLGLEAHVYYEAAAVVIFFILLGKLLEERARSRTSSAIKKLIGLQPKTAQILKHGQVQEIEISAIAVGDTLVVRPGERIAVDGRVSEGDSYVDESMISGEAIPAAKRPGDAVYAGSVNQKGGFYFKAEKIGAETLLAQIIRTVEAAQNSKAPVQRLADRIAGIFVPIVLGIALLTFLVWYFAGGEQALGHALLTSITVLVIACPCALGLATPTAIIAGVGKGAETGILIKDAAALETAHKVDTVVFDKTGTLTEGKPAVADQYWVEPRTAQRENLLFSMEKRSEHPLAEAICAAIGPHQPDMLALERYQSITGKGVEARYENSVVRVGALTWLLQEGVELPASAQENLETWASAAYTIVGFADAGRLIALFALADQLKPGAAEAVQNLKKAGIQTVMLTGDQAASAAAIARQAGIEIVESGMLPADKARYIRDLQAKGHIVGMTGDGINDAEALALADVGIAMGKGSDIALETAKMTLLNSDLRILPKALILSSQTVKTIRQNLFWAFFYNLIGIPIAAGVLYPVNGFLLHPMIAGAAMALSSVSVVSNSLRLRNLKL